MQDEAPVQKYTETLIQMTNDFCDHYLDEEYKALSLWSMKEEQ